MRFQETSEQALLRQAVRRLALSFGPAYFVEKARRKAPTSELWEALAEAGFLGVHIGQEYGGGGMGISELALVQEELSAAGCPALLLLVTPAICGPVLSGFGSPAQRDRWLPALARGQAKIVFAVTEPDAGSNTHQLTTVATRDGDGYRLRGSKYYISGVDQADAILVVARSGQDERGRGALSLFLVDVDAKGLERAVIPMSFPAPEKQFTLFFDDVYLPQEALVGEEGKGFIPLFAGLNPERILGAALANGIGRFALERGAQYARERSVWGAPIGTHQGIAHPLARAAIELELARLMTQKAAALYDANLDAGEASNMAKYAAAEAGIGAVDQAMQTHGGNGMADEYHLGTYWGIVRTLRIAPVSREMILNYVAQHTLGLPKSY